MNRRLFAMTVGAIALTTLAGCASTSQTAATPMKQNARVGVVAIGGESATHVHIGLTAFQNSESERSSTWPVTDMMNGAVTNAVAARPSTTVQRVTNAGLLGSQSKVFQLGWSSPKLRDDIKPAIQQAAAEQQLDYIVALAPWRGQVDSDVGIGAEGFGLLTRCGFGVCRDYVYSNYLITVIDTAALEIIGYSENKWPIETKRIDFKNKDVKTLGSTEVDLVRPDFEKGLSDRIVEALKRAGIN